MITRKSKIKVLVIIGQTASGKSDLAVELAKKYNGEVVSADSRQVYRGLNIGTGKITKTDMKGVQHHLLDVVAPRSSFSAADFVRRGRKAIEEIQSRGKLPIVAGGTMFYIDALLGNVQIPEVSPNEKLRTKLERRSLTSLLTKLRKLDPRRAQALQQDGQAENRRRIIRAIEIATYNKAHDKLRPCPRFHLGQGGEYDVLKIGIKVNKDELQERIKLRTAKRMRIGMVAEARKLHKNGLSYKRMRNLGLEYRYLADFLQNKITKEELIQRIERDDWRYAKKQMAWWKRDKEIGWYTLKEQNKIEKLAQRFLSCRGDRT